MTWQEVGCVVEKSYYVSIVLRASVSYLGMTESCPTWEGLDAAKKTIRGGGTGGSASSSIQSYNASHPLKCT